MFTVTQFRVFPISTSVDITLVFTVNSRVVLTRGSYFKTILRRVIFTPLMCRFDFNSRFDSDVGSK